MSGVYFLKNIFITPSKCRLWHVPPGADHPGPLATPLWTTARKRERTVPLPCVWVHGPQIPQKLRKFEPTRRGNQHTAENEGRRPKTKNKLIWLSTNQSAGYKTSLPHRCRRKCLREKQSNTFGNVLFGATPTFLRSFAVFTLKSRMRCRCVTFEDPMPLMHATNVSMRHPVYFWSTLGLLYFVLRTPGSRALWHSNMLERQISRSDFVFPLYQTS